jgi:LmbE family N-acetylglucosaminyl deacetylase
MDAVSRVIRAEGTPEAAWRPWLQTQPFAQQSLSSLMGVADRLVVVAPHPDDEILGCGGLLAMQAERDGQVLVIGVTDGEQSHAGMPEVDHGALAVQRAAERLEGVGRLGVPRDNVLPLRLPDAALNAHAHRLAMRLEWLLTPADLVISTWRHDGHPDHDASGLAASRACALIGCRHVEALVWMWNWAKPGDARVPWQRMVALPLSPRAQAAKRSALAAHATQLTARGPSVGPVLGDDIRASATRSNEYFLT